VLLQCVLSYCILCHCMLQAAHELAHSHPGPALIRALSHLIVCASADTRDLLAEPGVIDSGGVLVLIHDSFLDYEWFILVQIISNVCVCVCVCVCVSRYASCIRLRTITHTHALCVVFIGLEYNRTTPPPTHTHTHPHTHQGTRRLVFGRLAV